MALQFAFHLRCNSILLALSCQLITPNDVNAHSCFEISVIFSKLHCGIIKSNYLPNRHDNKS